MKKLLLAVGLMALAGTTLAAGKSCEELQGEIEQKIQANGATGYSLQIVDKADYNGSQGKEVGRCEGDTKVIAYKRG